MEQGNPITEIEDAIKAFNEEEPMEMPGFGGSRFQRRSEAPPAEGSPGGTSLPAGKAKARAEPPKDEDIDDEEEDEQEEVT